MRVARIGGINVVGEWEVDFVCKPVQESEVAIIKVNHSVKFFLWYYLCFFLDAISLAVWCL